MRVRIRLCGPIAFTAMWLASQPATSQGTEGLYTTAQASQGQALYGGFCARCHESDLTGGTGPALTGRVFRSRWSAPDRSVSELATFIQTKMPLNAGGSMSADQYAAVTAYILSRNGITAASRELALGDSTLLFRRLDPDPAQAASSGTKAAKSQLTRLTSGPDQRELTNAVHDSSDWLYATHDYSGRRYAALSEITSANASHLHPVCAFQLGDLAPFETNPVEYQGVLFVTTSHATMAIDAVHCVRRWEHVWDPTYHDPALANRGVAIADGKVIRETADGRLLALDANTGGLVWQRHVAGPTQGELMTGTPLVYDSIIVIGTGVGEFGANGWVGAFRLSDGSPMWRFDVVPKSGQPGSETWPSDSTRHHGGGGVWAPMTLDPAQGLVFVATGNPTPDLPGQLREGANLYTSSLIALDVHTGALRWYKQLVPHDVNDWDLTQAGPLYDEMMGGRRRDLIATVGKEGVLRAVDRETHDVVFAADVTTRSRMALSDGTRGEHVCPGVTGGVEWNGPAFSPQTNMLYVPAVDWCSTFRPADSAALLPGVFYMGGKVSWDSTGGRGWVTAIDAGTGAIRWRYHASSPMLASVVPTAGGVVLTGELQGDFLVLDARTGAERYRFYTGAPVSGGIMTYGVGGHQYVAVPSGSITYFWQQRSGAATIYVFGLN